jgi:hypothetical protein
VEAYENAVTLPRNKSLWTAMGKHKNKDKPKFLPILVGRGMSKDLKFLKQVTKYPFRHITEHWDGQVVQCISKFGIVGIASNTVAEHNLLRRFWHTYGVDVIEDVDNGLKLPSDAQTISFLELLSHKHNLLLASKTNHELSIDCDLEQQKWLDVMDSVRPSSLLIGFNTDPFLFHRYQGQTFRLDSIPQAKLIKEKE